MTDAPLTSEKLGAARRWIEECLDALNPGMAATNTSLVNGIEALVHALKDVGEPIGDDSVPQAQSGNQSGVTSESAGASRVASTQLESSPVGSEDHNLMALMKRAQVIVEGKYVWKRFIDGTPLSNDIAVWMAEFAREVLDEAGPSRVRGFMGSTPWGEIDDSP